MPTPSSLSTVSSTPMRVEDVPGFREAMAHSVLAAKLNRLVRCSRSLCARALSLSMVTRRGPFPFGTDPNRPFLLHRFHRVPDRLVEATVNVDRSRCLGRTTSSASLGRLVPSRAAASVQRSREPSLSGISSGPACPNSPLIDCPVMLNCARCRGRCCSNRRGCSSGQGQLDVGEGIAHLITPPCARSDRSHSMERFRHQDALSFRFRDVREGDDHTVNKRTAEMAGSGGLTIVCIRSLSWAARRIRPIRTYWLNSTRSLFSGLPASMPRSTYSPAGSVRWSPAASVHLRAFEIDDDVALGVPRTALNAMMPLCELSNAFQAAFRQLTR